MVPEIGLGTWRYTGGPEPLRRGVELGANLIDTAEMYRTEAAVGEAIAGIRDKVIVATKVLGSNLRYDEVLKAAEKSLRLLAVDKVDLYQIHWPNPRVPIAETMRAMDRLVSDGRVEHVGVSNFSVDEMREAQAAMPNVPIVSNQILYNLRRRSAERDVIPYCRRNDITVIAYSPLHEGALAGDRGGRIRRALGRNRDNEVLEEIAGEVGKTVAQIALELGCGPGRGHRHPEIQQRRQNGGQLRGLRLEPHDRPTRSLGADFSDLGGADISRRGKHSARVVDPVCALGSGMVRFAARIR